MYSLLCVTLVWVGSLFVLHPRDLLSLSLSLVVVLGNGGKIVTFLLVSEEKVFVEKGTFLASFLTFRVFEG